MQRLCTYIVEDSPIVLENLIDTLEELAPVQVQGSGGDESAALEWLLQAGAACDLVIIDVYLHSGSGLGVLRGLADSGLPARRVVLTNYATPDMRKCCLRLGAHRVFDKSSEIDDLISCCCRLAMETSERKRQLPN